MAKAKFRHKDHAYPIYEWDSETGQVTWSYKYDREVNIAHYTQDMVDNNFKRGSWVVIEDDGDVLARNPWIVDISKELNE